MQRLWDLAHALDVRSKRMARDLGVTGPQRLVVRVVGQSPGIAASQIASTLGMHPSTLTGVLGRLQRQGLIDRAVDPDDRRRAQFTLTAKGARIDRERKGTVEAAVRRGLARAGDPMILATTSMIALLVAELGRDDD
jgi:DNA-binding MarR family transcriptional regulator